MSESQNGRPSVGINFTGLPIGLAASKSQTSTPLFVGIARYLKKLFSE